MNERKFQSYSKYWIILCFMLFYARVEIKAQINLPDIVKKVKPSTIVILTYNKAGVAIGQGSGFFISREGDVITNMHVLEGASRAEIKTSEGKTYTINQVVAEDKEGDLIRVSVNITPYAVLPLPISSSLPSEGEHIIVIGNPLGLEQTISDGIVSAVRDIPGYGKIIQISAPISPGSSGSPVVNMKGEVVGVATLIVLEGQNLNFAISSEKIGQLVIGKAQPLPEWQADRAEVHLVSKEESFNTGVRFF